MSSILITGASRGIGRAAAIELTGRGHRVIATARDLRTLDDLEVDTRLRLDVTDQASVDAAIAASGDIDVLLANAGIMSMGAVEAYPTDEIDRLFAHNVTGAVRVTQAVLPQMRARQAGRLVFVSSALGRVVLPSFAPYSASKWALEAFGEALAIELQPFGIDVVLAQPGPVSNGLVESLTSYNLPDDPYGPVASFPSEIFSSQDDVVDALVTLIEAATVPLRSPVGPFAQQLLDDQHAAPYNQPYVVGA